MRIPIVVGPAETMRIRACRLLPYRLPLRRPWHTHRGTLTERCGWILVLHGADGIQGHGDCAPLPAAGTESPAQARQWLQERLAGLPDRYADEVLTSLPAPGPTPAARHALETALLDLLSQTRGITLRHRLAPHAADRLPLNGAAGALDEGAPRRCAELLARGFRVLKLKVGLAPPAEELARLRRLCGELPSATRLRLDANGAWQPSQAGVFLQGIEGLPIESLEEPLAQPHPERLRELQASTPIPLALDESLPDFETAQLLENPPVRRLILKPPVLGGLLPAFTLARQAARAGLETLVTSTLESAVGVQAAAQLAAAILRPEHPLAQGLATGDWLREDVAAAAQITDGGWRLSATPGLGIRLKPAFLQPTQPGATP